MNDRNYEICTYYIKKSHVIQTGFIYNPQTKIRLAKFYHQIDKKKMYHDETLFIAKVFCEGGAVYSCFFIKGILTDFKKMVS